MVENAENNGPVWAEQDDKRNTRVGRSIRKWRLDEIPQMFNVLKGDVSFVGPRPERAYFVKKLREEIPFYSQRFFVKPGITGLAQVKYQYGASKEDALEKLKYDLYYIKNLSLLFDVLIIFETIKVVLSGKGAR
jgi:lipopolysaccharide/colanic/teichoic acid biosynthesis glycosyltransferase